MNNLSDYYQVNINKPEIIKHFSDVSTILVINSLDRNKYLFPNPNNYIIEIDDNFRDVLEIELISIDYEYNRLIIDNSNSHLYFEDTNNNYLYKIIMPNGIYDLQNEIVSKFNYIYGMTKGIDDNIKNDIVVKYNDILDNMYFLINYDNINQINKLNLLYKGRELSYPSTLYGDILTDTDIFEYRQKTNGKFFGFSEKDFSNKLKVLKLNIEYISNYDHKLIIEFLNSEEYNIFNNILSINDNDLIITFKNIDNLIYNINHSDIKGFKTNNETNKIEIIVTISSILQNIVIGNPDLCTNIILGDINYDLKRDLSIFLDIKELNRLNSKNKNVNNSFASIPVNHANKIYFDNTKNYGTIKYFNPPLRNMDKLSISFKDINGEVLENNGKENSIVFAIKCLNNQKSINN